MMIVAWEINYSCWCDAEVVWLPLSQSVWRLIVSYWQVILLLLSLFFLLLLLYLGGRIAGDAKQGDYVRLLMVRKNWNHGKLCAQTNNRPQALEAGKICHSNLPTFLGTMYVFWCVYCTVLNSPLQGSQKLRTLQQGRIVCFMLRRQTDAVARCVKRKVCTCL